MVHAWYKFKPQSQINNFWFKTTLSYTHFVSLCPWPCRRWNSPSLKVTTNVFLFCCCCCCFETTLVLLSQEICVNQSSCTSITRRVLGPCRSAAWMINFTYSSTASSSVLSRKKITSHLQFISNNSQLGSWSSEKCSLEMSTTSDHMQQTWMHRYILFTFEWIKLHYL